VNVRRARSWIVAVCSSEIRAGISCSAEAMPADLAPSPVLASGRMYLSSKDRKPSVDSGRSHADTRGCTPGRPSTAQLISLPPSIAGSMIARRSSSKASASASASSGSSLQRLTPTLEPSDAGLAYTGSPKRERTRAMIASAPSRS
jgi:hypothetical protein